MRLLALGLCFPKLVSAVVADSSGLKACSCELPPVNGKDFAEILIRRVCFRLYWPPVDTLRVKGGKLIKCRNDTTSRTSIK